MIFPWFDLADVISNKDKNIAPVDQIDSFPVLVTATVGQRFKLSIIV